MAIAGVDLEMSRPSTSSRGDEARLRRPERRCARTR